MCHAQRRLGLWHGRGKLLVDGNQNGRLLIPIRGRGCTAGTTSTLGRTLRRFGAGFWLTLLGLGPSGVHERDDYGLVRVLPQRGAWVGPVLGTFVYVWGGWPFLKGAVSEVRDCAGNNIVAIPLAAGALSWGRRHSRPSDWRSHDELVDDRRGSQRTTPAPGRTQTARGLGGLDRLGDNVSGCGDDGYRGDARARD